MAKPEEKYSNVDPSKHRKSFLNLVETPKPGQHVYPNIDAPKKEDASNFGKNTTFIAASHFFKALFSPTILVMPSAFMNGGLMFSVFGHILLTTLISYNIGRLLVCADYLSKRENLMVQTYGQLAFVSFDKCSNRTKSFAKPFRVLVNVLMIATTLDAISIFIIFIARNSVSIASYYFPDINFTPRLFIFFLMVPIMLSNTIRELKYLSPFSVLATVFLYVGAISCFAFYLARDNPDVWVRNQIGDHSIIRFIAVILFSQSGISIALTLRSSMKKPEQFLKFPGVFFTTIFLTTMIYVPFGYFGYLHYGEETKPSIMLNLPNHELKSVLVKIATIIAVFLTIPITFYVAFNAMWNNFIKSNVKEVNQLSVEYFSRSCMAVVLFALSFAFPTLGPMIVIKGALLHSQLEVIYPPILDYVAFYPEKGAGRGYCRLIRAILIASVGILFCLSGVCIGIYDFIEGYEELQ